MHTINLAHPAPSVTRHRLAMPMRLPTRLLFAWLLAPGWACSNAIAGTVLCDVDYGGVRQQLVVKPAADPYALPTMPFGSHFRLRVLLVETPADLARIRIDTFAEGDKHMTPLHVGTWPLPKVAGDFTGQQRIYEPLRDGELLYRCAWEAN